MVNARLVRKISELAMEKRAKKELRILKAQIIHAAKNAESHVVIYGFISDEATAVLELKGYKLNTEYDIKSKTLYTTISWECKSK